MAIPRLRLAIPPGGPGDTTEPEEHPIRVVLADDHALMRRSLRMLLDDEEDIEVISEAENLPTVVHDVNGDQPDVLVLDLGIPDGPGNAVISELRERAPETQIVVLTMQENPAYAQHALTAGALGFVLKDQADEELAWAIRLAASGEHFVSPKVAAGLDAVDRSLSEDKLTRREIEVLRLIALGHTSVEIARRLELSPRTVESHRARIHGKLGLATRAGLVQFALRRGLLRA